MKRIFLFLCLSFSLLASGSGLKTLVYPSLIYDDLSCPVYSKDYATELTFLFFYDGDQKITDLAASGTILELDLPAGLKILESSIMDGWKKPNSRQLRFPSVPIQIRNQPYVRYTVNLPGGVFQPALREPLPGGMFGGCTNNLIMMLIKPAASLPKTFTIRWRTVGKYRTSGEFPAVLVSLPSPFKGKLRTDLRSQAPLVNLGYSDAALKNHAKILRHAGIQKVEAQLPDGPNRGNRRIWQDAGFEFYGGGDLMHVLIRSARDDSDNPEDYLIGLDGRRARGIDGRAYHHRLWCPTAVVTPGRYPWKLLINSAEADVSQGATAIDADFETHIWSHCFCPACLRSFFSFSGIEPEELPPPALIRKYPMEWYRFRCEQTRQIYEQLRKYLLPRYPGLQIGANAINHHFENDLGKLKYGMCDFAEDPRLLADSIDYVLADTLVGGLYDAICVDTLSSSVSKPVIAVAGSSYCVGFDHTCMAGRRMTAEMTGDRYGYAQRPEFLKLGMIHFAANGARGLRYSLDDATVTQAATEGAEILRKVEDYYIDGTRADQKFAIADLTRGESPWNRDTTRVRGKIWKYYYDKYNGKVQSRIHEKDGEYLISLFNWDPFQEKCWHISAKDKNMSGTLLDVITSTKLTAGSQPEWSSQALRTGFSIKVPPAGFRIFRLTRTPPPLTKCQRLAVEKSTIPEYNQYEWYSGGQINMARMAENGLKRPLQQIKTYGGKRLQETAPGPSQGIISLPFTAAFSQKQRGMTCWGTVSKGILYSAEKYCFLNIKLPRSRQPLLLTLECSGTVQAKFGALLVQSSNFDKCLQNLSWGEPVHPGKKMNFIIKARHLSQDTHLFFYQLTKGANLSIHSLSIRQTNAKDQTVNSRPRPAQQQQQDLLLPFSGIFQPLPEGVISWGKNIQGQLSSGGKYCFTSFCLPSSLHGIKVRLFLRSPEEGQFGLMVYRREPNTSSPGSVLCKPFWGRKLNSRTECLEFTVPGGKDSQPTAMMCYSIDPQKDCLIEKAEITEVPQP